MRRKRITANFAAALSGKVVVALQQLLLVPVFLSKWGAEYYGAWLVLTAIPTMLSMSNLGLGMAAYMRIVLEIGKGDEEKANSLLLTSSIMICSILSVVIMAIVFLPISVFSGATSGEIEDPKSILLFLMGGIGLNLMTQPLEGFWVARKRASTSILFKTIRTLAQFVATTIVLLLGGMASEVAEATFATSLIWVTIYTAISMGHIKWSNSFYWNWGMLKSLYIKGLGFQTNSLWNAILFQGSVVLANSILGPVGAATWGSIRMLTRTGVQLIEVTKQALFPEIQNSVAKCDWSQVRNLHSISITFAITIGFIGAIVMSTMGPWLFSTWTNSELQTVRLDWIILATGLVINSIWWASEAIHWATNQPWRMNVIGVLGAIASLGIMWTLAESGLGITGFAIGSVGFDMIMATYVIRKSLAITGDQFRECLGRGYCVIKQLPSYTAATLSHPLSSK